jgi:hypothetical protein
VFIHLCNIMIRAPLEARNPSGFPLFSLGQLPTSILTRAEATPSFGSCLTRDVSALPTPFPRGARTPPPDSRRRHPVLSSRVPRFLDSFTTHVSTPCAAAPPRRLPVCFTTPPPLLLVVQVNAYAATRDLRERAGSKVNAAAALASFARSGRPKRRRCLGVLRQIWVAHGRRAAATPDSASTSRWASTRRPKLCTPSPRSPANEPPPSCSSINLQQEPLPLAPPTGDPSPAEPMTGRSWCASFFPSRQFQCGASLLVLLPK